MQDRLVSVDENFDFPEAVIARQTQRLGDAQSPEGEILHNTTTAASKMVDALHVPLPYRGAMGVLRTSLATIDSAPGQRVNIVFTGSSTTSADTTEASKRWINMLAAGITKNPVLSLSAAHTNKDTLPSGINIINGGASGARSENYLSSNRGVWAAALNPRLVVHTIGANDYYGQVSIADYRKNLLAGISLINGATSGPVVHLLVHSFGRNDMGKPPITWDSYRQVMLDLSLENPDSIVFLDLSETFASVGIPGADTFQLLMADKVHLNDRGHRVYADIITKALDIPKTRVATPPQKPIIYDSFDRPNGALGFTPEGKIWLSSGGSYAIADGAAKITSVGLAPALGGATAFFDSGLSDGSVEVEGLGPNIGILFRASNDGTGYYFMWSGAGGEFRLGIRSGIDGSYLKLAGTGTTIPYKATNTLRVGFNGPLIQAFSDGVKVLEITDTRHTGAHVGITGVVGGAQALSISVKESSTRLGNTTSIAPDLSNPGLYVTEDSSDRLIAVDENLDIPLAIQKRQSQRFADTKTVEGSVLADKFLSREDTLTTLGLAKLRAALAIRNTAAVPIVFAGSSTTEGVGASHSSENYVSAITRSLHEAYPSKDGEAFLGVRVAHNISNALPLSTGIHVFNVGLGGASATSYIDEFRRNRITQLQPRVIFHMVGSNDNWSGKSAADFKRDLKSVINSFKTTATVPLIQILIQQHLRWDKTSNIPWSDYAKVMKEISLEDPTNVCFIDVSKDFEIVGVPGEDPLNLVGSDNIHLTDAGYRFMSDLILEKLGLYTQERKVPKGSSIRATSDSFSGPNATTLYNRATDGLLGGNGEIWKASVIDAFGIKDGTLVAGALQQDSFAAVTRPPGIVEVSAKVNRMAETLFWLVASRDAISNPTHQVRVAINSAGAQIVYSLAGNASAIGDVHPITAGQEVRLRLDGLDISLLLDGKVVESGKLPSDGVGGFTGIARSATSTTFSISDFCVDTYGN